MSDNDDKLRRKAQLLEKMLNTESCLRASSKKEIVFSEPLITKNGVPIIRRGTINLIQGKQGAHKSRLAELFASLLIGSDGCNAQRLGFEKNPNETITVVYLDTERSIKEEFPAAVKNILTNAGFDVCDDVGNFRCASLKNIDRFDRLNALQAYIESIRNESPNPIFFLVDVVTDGIKSFNDDQESMQLMDLLGRMCDENDATVLLVIHENPGGDKARGHLGTEALNKASTAMQIGYEKGQNEQIRGYLTLKFKKQRHSDCSTPIALSFCAETNSLILANQELLLNDAAQRDRQITKEAVVEVLANLNGVEFPQSELIPIVTEKIGCGKTTAKARLKEIAESNIHIQGPDCSPCILKIRNGSGVPTIYELVNLQHAC